MYRCITQVQTTNDFQLVLEFDGKEKRVFDVKPIFPYGRFAELQDKVTFEKVHISFDTVEWENGLDLFSCRFYGAARFLSGNVLTPDETAFRDHRKRFGKC